MSELAYLYLKQKGLTSPETAMILSGKAAEEAAERSRRLDFVGRDAGAVAVNPGDVLPQVESGEREG